MSSFRIVRVPIMKVAKIQTFLIAVVIFNFATLNMPTGKCYATEEVQALPNVIYRSAYNATVPEMTDEQWRRIAFLYAAYNQTKANFQDQITKVNRELVDLFGKPFPQTAEVLAKQEEINRIETSLDIVAVETAVQIRAVLSRSQLRKLFLADIDTMFRSIRLTDEQRKQMESILDAYGQSKEKQDKSLAQLQYEKELLLSNPTVDEKALFAKQGQISTLEAQKATDELKMKLKLRSVLTWNQKNQLYNCHRGDMFKAVDVTAAQDEKIMQMHCQRENTTNQARKQMIQLGADLIALYKQSDSTSDSLMHIQSEIDKVAGQARIEETKFVPAFREALTAPQRDKLAELLKLERQGKLPELPYPEASCPMHHTR
ncbi:MAG: Spy/CpxP family protein refolding chaperone [Candidatus Obscuribacterales bacterium]|nr:Spy/CpxP family protein refolding chaperone [Candidatus Obscuribacterales bacterium]